MFPAEGVLDGDFHVMDPVEGENVFKVETSGGYLVRFHLGAVYGDLDLRWQRGEPGVVDHGLPDEIGVDVEVPRKAYPAHVHSTSEIS